MPSGAVEWGFLLWLIPLLIGVASGSGAAVVVGTRLFAARDRAIAEVASDASDARKQLEREMSVKVEAIHARLEMADQELARTLGAFQVHAGETYATRKGVTEAIDRLETRMEATLGRLSNQIDAGVTRLAERIDRLAGDGGSRK